MLLALKLIVVLWFAYVKCQSSGTGNTCTGPPTFICNAGGKDGSVGEPPAHSNGNIAQGRPGKTGVKGVQGLQGAKGQKGEQGTPEDVSERLRKLENELQEFKSSLVNPPKSCDYINGTADQSGVYLISPDSSIVTPFYVHCNFTGTTTETIISHDSTNEISVAKCEPARCYKRKIKYDVALPQVIALIEQSQSCRQFIKYRCVASFMFQNNNPTFATWLSRDGSAQIYWGGATSRRDRYCACGETGTCENNSFKCNCDKNSSPETSDEGYLTDKDSLPVTELQFGDNSGSDERAWHTLGPLICSGRSQD